MKKILCVCLMLLLLTGCSSEREEAIYPEVDTQPLQQILNKQDTINGYKSVVNENDVLIAIDIKRMKRFKKEKIEKKIKKQLEEKLPNKEILVSGDLKIRWELEEIIDKKLKTKELTKKIEEIKLLSKEET
ncbi:YhcN/YlaJ family sporulation lipoprotein [Bacillus sp. FJAT-22090]|uniref:YhcN/YlaJ family sporulation lipoprotein n=1 Tax=Bacillus sp. FJAT-22090 TaxID=1581038 RepID=UPI0011A394D2|nr:YhcN/YlaJ family sporulation lipoprotein [Bacillus sp. FJAT-22090]